MITLIKIVTFILDIKYLIFTEIRTYQASTFQI